MPANRIHLNRKTSIAALGALLALAAFLALGAGLSSARTGATASGSATVSIAHFKYKPTPLTVKKGTRVVFANHDSVPHTATLKGSFSTGRIRPGKAVAVRFSAPGVYAYHCTLHPEMHGKVVVRR
jgi:plastocyanin